MKHYFIDFGDILGSDGIRPKYAWSGHEYTIDPKGGLVQMVHSRLLHAAMGASGVSEASLAWGVSTAWSFDPLTWKPNYPNPAFLKMDREDAFWAAKQVAAFTDAEIRALVETGQYSDPRAAEWISNSLIKRRDKIAEAWFSRVPPLDKFGIVDGKLTFEDLGARYDFEKGREYSVRWATCDDKGRLTPLPGGAGRDVPALQSSSPYLAAVIECADTGKACGRGITVYLRVRQTVLEVVGIDR